MALGPGPGRTERGRAGSRRARVVASLAIVGAGALGACSSGPKNFNNENDDLRREREHFKDRVALLEAELGEAQAKIDEMRAALSLSGEGPRAEVLAALPRCAGIEIDRLSGPVDRDGEPGYPESIAVYVKPFDGRRRFVQIAGTLAVEASYIPLANPGAIDDQQIRGAAGAASDTGRPAGNLLGRTTLGPEQLREAYRSGFMGTHYTVDVVPRADVRVTEGAIVIAVTFLDELTGRRHEAWRVIRLPR